MSRRPHGKHFTNKPKDQAKARILLEDFAGRNGFGDRRWEITLGGIVYDINELIRSRIPFAIVDGKIEVRGSNGPER